VAGLTNVSPLQTSLGPLLALLLVACEGFSAKGGQLNSPLYGGMHKAYFTSANTLLFGCTHETLIIFPWFKYGDFAMPLHIHLIIDESEEQELNDHHDQFDDDEIFHPTLSYPRCFLF
jgi:hypothetical protein